MQKGVEIIGKLLQVEKTGEKLNEVSGDLFADFERERKAFVIGKVAREVVRTPNGTQLVFPGQLITSAHAAVAQNLGILTQLYRVASSDRPVKFPVSVEGENSDRVKKETTNRDRKIRNALGRPVTKVIRDRNRRVILDLGDLITYQAVERARQADVLDRLLDAVYEK